MPVFSYKARNRRNQLLEGIIDAASEEMVASLLIEKSLTIISIEPMSATSLNLQFFRLIRRVKSKDLVIFFRQLAVMIEANLPIIKALRILVKQTENKYLKTVIASVTDEVDGGEKLSGAMANFPDVFSDFYVNITRSGETSGRLSEVMNYLADQQEKDYDLQSKVKGAMIYPLFIIVALFVVGLILLTFVVPQMTAILKESGVTLPLATRVLIGVSDFFKAHWWQLGIVLVVGGFALTIQSRTVKGRRFINTIKVSIPVFGMIYRQMYVVRIARSLGTLLRGGVPVARALGVVKDVVKNTVYEDILAQTIREVEEGNLIAGSFIESPQIPPMVSQMISIGEETGELEKVLDKITEFYSREIDNSVRNLSVLIEPVIMVVIGVAVGFFVAAIIMPMWQLSASL